MIEDDGDIIRGLGHVTYNAAHLEGWIDELLCHLSLLEEYSDKEKKYPISRKLKKAKNILSKLNDPIADEICADIDECADHFEWRNELVHGRIYAPDYHELNLQSSRPGVPDRKADSAELYTLANNLNVLAMKMYRPTIFALPRLIRQKLSDNV